MAELRKVNGSYLHFGGMTWPNPLDPNEVQRKLRFGEPTKADLLVAAAFMDAYAHLIALPSRTRAKRVAEIRALLAEYPPAGTQGGHA